MSKTTLVGVIWWPHSGGRWLCRSIMKPHPKVHETAFTHPWIFFSSDMTLELDITAQVHKARSLPELKPHLNALKESTDLGRELGLKHYFDYIRTNYLAADAPETHILGEMCMGSPIPRVPDLPTIMKACPDLKIIHLVRNPESSFPSFVNRHELDSDPIRIGGSWATLNAGTRKFFDINTQYADNYLCVRYEDLMANANESCERICDFAGLDFDPVMTAKLEERWGRNTTSKEQQEFQAIIREVAGRELAAYDY